MKWRWYDTLVCILVSWPIFFLAILFSRDVDDVERKAEKWFAKTMYCIYPRCRSMT